jgi:hypothetical protein
MIASSVETRLLVPARLGALSSVDPMSQPLHASERTPALPWPSRR